MPAQTLEERVSELEKKVAELQGEKAAAPQAAPWWQQWFGAFKDNPDFDAAMERGAEYRRAQPNPADNFDALELDYRK